MRKVRVFHFDLPAATNTGDLILFETVRQVFERFGGGTHFEIVGARNLRELVTDDVIDRINATSDIVVIGGGGLFLADTNKNENSGWQWNCPLPVLKRLQKPIAVFAVGYNRFRGQGDFSNIYREHVNETLKRSVFFGLRNSGSIASVKEYIADPRDHETIGYQPCPTTIISFLAPHTENVQFEPGNIALNVAMDRADLRFSHGTDVFFQQMLSVTEQFGARTAISAVGHIGTDARFIRWLTKRNADVKSVLFHKPVLIDEVLRFYRQQEVVIGMRGHAQMVPFGLGVPIISIISHNKMRYFLEDAGLADFGVDVNDPDLVKRIADLVGIIRADRTGVVARIATARQRFHDVTVENLRTIYQGVTGESASATSFVPSSQAAWSARSYELLSVRQSKEIGTLRRERNALAGELEKLRNGKAELSAGEKKWAKISRKHGLRRIAAIARLLVKRA